MLDFAIEKISQASLTTNVNVYELEQVGNPSLVYLQIEGLPDADRCRASRDALQLPAVSFSGIMSVVLNTYVLRTNNLDNLYRLYAHYGLFRAASFDFDATSALASTDSNYLYELQFQAIDVKKLIANNQAYFVNYNVIQQISFDIAEYDILNRRIDITSIHSTTDYDKLATRIRLQKNELLISCTDTNGRHASQYLAEQANVAEESIQCSCMVSLRTIDNAGQTLNAYSILVANEDYSDNDIDIALPAVSQETAAAEIKIRYLIEIITTGDIIALQNRLVLTDEQISNLMLTFGLGQSMNIDDLIEQLRRQQSTMRTIAEHVY